ncbi:unnamed protein product [Polarella glacialis]|uniref:Uncharacterized protein n=1 Tax=Polarella glacialis TaxID=89957 RepID=A0A813FAG8_POLGL|nr:unnamed protein product [Polarella glacialis]
MGQLVAQVRVVVFVACRKGMPNNSLVRSKLLQAGVPRDRLFIKQSYEYAENAADAILTFLFGRYAGARNYLISDDRKWFKEVMHLDPKLCTVWITSDKFREP